MTPAAQGVETDAPATSEACERFRLAVLALERRVDDADPGQRAAARAQRLGESARLLAEAFLAARGRRPADHRARLAGLDEKPVIDSTATRLLADALSIGENTDWSPGRTGELERLEWRYRAMLPDYRSALVREVPDCEDACSLCRRTVASRGFILALAVVALASVALSVAYRLSDPHYAFELSGQLFWKRSPGEPFIEQRSRRFNVQVDNAVHRYTVSLPEPVRVSALRLDPVNKIDATGVEIRGVRLIAQGTDSPVDLTPRLGTSWSCVNCRWVARGEGAWRLRPLNDDPHIIGPPTSPVETTSVEIELRAAAKKTFWEWMSRLEKSY